MTALSSRIISGEQQPAWQRWVAKPLVHAEESGVISDGLREAMLQRGYDEGYAAGQRAGLAAAAELAHAESARLAALFASARADMDSLGTLAATDMVDLAIAIARRVTGHELKAQPDVIVSIVREALASTPPDPGDALLHLHPADAGLVRDRIGVELAQHRWRIVENEAITPGGCRVIADRGELDASMETRWLSVLSAIEKQYEHDGAG
jgi:flagellar assembly protein FliH